MDRLAEILNAYMIFVVEGYSAFWDATDSWHPVLVIGFMLAVAAGMQWLLPTWAFFLLTSAILIPLIYFFTWMIVTFLSNRR